MKTGKIVAGRWKVLKLLGKGSCGVVYQVEDIKRKGFSAAMKIETISKEVDPTLKLEVGVLKKMTANKEAMRLFDYGRRSKYTFMVTTLCGQDLITLRAKIRRGFNDSSGLRIAVFILGAIKQLHEIGYVHRDIKPGNVIMGGQTGRESRRALLIDFGMARSFVQETNGKKCLRQKRSSALLRGTIRYCSLNVHARGEQGRCDDLVALMYMIVEITVGVPWREAKEEKAVVKLKKDATVDELFNDLPEELKSVFQYVATLKYEDRPNYHKIYESLMQAIKRLNINFLDPFEWEDAEMEKDKAEMKTQTEKENDRSVLTDVASTSASIGSKKSKTSVSNESIMSDKASVSEEAPPLAPPTTAKATATQAATPPPAVTSSTSLTKACEEMNTAIDYNIKELETKKALPREDLQFHVFPSIQEINFRETAQTF